MKRKPFYLVWNPHHPKSPTQRHASFHAADAEAQRLALTNPGQDFFVLEAKSVSFKRDVTTVMLDKHNDIPF